MKKLLGIVALGLLLSGNAHAGVNEPGSGPIVSITEVKNYYYENLAQVKKKNKHLIQYLSINNDGKWASWSLHVKKIDEKSHEKAYKKCVKNSAKYNIQEDCFIFAIDDKIVWNVDGLAKPKEPESAESKAEKEKQAQLDKRPGRFFEDQPDVSDDFQFHLIYFLDNKTKDKERDISGYIEKEMKKADDAFFKMTKNKQRFKFDYREDGKLDVTFVRMDRKARSGGWNVNYPDYYLTKNGFNNPKKMYLSFTDSASGDGGQMGPHHGYIFIGKAGSQYPQIIIHEMLHGLGFAMPCTKGVKDGAHMGSGILARGGGLQLPKALYGHDDSTCPDLKDSVYLTPTSDNPFDPLPIACALGQMKRGSPPGNFEIPARYTHKKLLKGRKNEWCTYNLHTYAEDDWFKKWKR